MNIYKGEPLNVLPGHQGRAAGLHHHQKALDRAAKKVDTPRRGTCGCGCGGQTGIAARTYSRRDWYMGQPVRFLPGHGTKGKRQPRRRKSWKRQLRKLGMGFFLGQLRNTLEARPQRLMLEARPLAVRQREALQQSGRRLCVACYQSRPTVAILDGGVCLVCVARQRKVAEVDRQLQVEDQAKRERIRDGSRQAHEAAKRNGTFRRPPGITIAPRRKR